MNIRKIKNNFVYNFKKIFIQISKIIINKNKIYDNFYFLNKSNIKDKKKIKSILLFFPDYKMMHFGDHLFFEPLAKYLMSHGFEVNIIPVRTMEFYFKNLGYRIKKNTHVYNYDLIISTINFINHLRDVNSDILLIDTSSSEIKTPLCNDIIHKVSLFLRLKKTIYNSIPSYLFINSVQNKRLSFLQNQNQNQNQKQNENKYIMFNNYFDSGKFRAALTNKNSIIRFVKKLKNKTGYKIIHTGSLDDLNNDPRIYDFVDYDLRGKTTIKDLFFVCAHKKVMYNVSIDGLQMHLFFIQNKKSFILFRGRFLKKNEYYVKNYVNPPFPHNKSKELIEYI